MKRYPFYEVKKTLFQSRRYVELVPGAKVGYEELYQQYPYTIGHKPLFNSYLSFVLLEEKIPATRYDDQGKTSGEFTIGREFWQSYVEGFTRGEKDFTLFATHNNKSEILEKYKSEWAYYETVLPLLISHETVEKFGYNAGMIAGVKKLGLIKEVPTKETTLSARQFAAFLWYNGERNLSGVNNYQHINELKERYKLCPFEAKQIYEMYGEWKSHLYRYGKGKTKKERSEAEKVYIALNDLPLSQREDFEKDRDAYYDTPAIEK